MWYILLVISNRISIGYKTNTKVDTKMYNLDASIDLQIYSHVIHEYTFVYCH